MDLVVMDECLPKKLKRLLPGHDVRTVPELGLASYKNGTLLKALAGKCKAFITIDSNLSFQQNLPALPFASPGDPESAGTSASGKHHPYPVLTTLHSRLI